MCYPLNNFVIKGNVLFPSPHSFQTEQSSVMPFFIMQDKISHSFENNDNNNFLIWPRHSVMWRIKEIKYCILGTQLNIFCDFGLLRVEHISRLYNTNRPIHVSI